MGFLFAKNMKYHKLSEAQFYEMHQEFAVFLASQGITKEEWGQIKKTNLLKVDELLETFSDLVWEKILTNCKFLEFTSPDQIFLFETLTWENIKNDYDSQFAGFLPVVLTEAILIPNIDLWLTKR